MSTQKTSIHDVKQSEESPLFKVILAGDVEKIKGLVYNDPDSSYTEISQLLKKNKDVLTSKLLEALFDLGNPYYWDTANRPGDESLRWLTLAKDKLNEAKEGLTHLTSSLPPSNINTHLPPSSITPNDSIPSSTPFSTTIPEEIKNNNLPYLQPKLDNSTQYEIGFCYEHGLKGFMQDLKSAVACYRQDAQQGNEDAQYRLGLCYEFGRGVEKNINLAFEWYINAAHQGNGSAINKLSKCAQEVRESDQAANIAEGYRLMAEENNASAQYMLGIFYNYGIGVEPNKKLANEWFQKAADQGKVLARYQLAINDPDQSSNQQFIKHLAEQGYTPAQFLVGSYYQEGKNGFLQNSSIAVSYYTAASKQGYDPAQLALGEMYGTANSAHFDLGMSQKYLSLAKYQGNFQAKNLLFFSSTAENKQFTDYSSNLDKSLLLEELVSKEYESTFPLQHFKNTLDDDDGDEDEKWQHSDMQTNDSEQQLINPSLYTGSSLPAPTQTLEQKARSQEIIASKEKLDSLRVQFEREFKSYQEEQQTLKRNIQALTSVCRKGSELLSLISQMEIELRNQKNIDDSKELQALRNKQEFILWHLKQDNINAVELSKKQEAFQKETKNKNEILPRSSSSEIKSNNLIGSNALVHFNEQLSQLKMLTALLRIEVENEKDDSKHANRFNGKIKKVNHLSDVTTALTEIISKQIFTRNSCLELILNLIQLNYFNQARDLFDFWTINLGKDSPHYFFNEIIKYCGKKHQLDLVLYFYGQAINFNKINTETFNYALDAVIRELDFKTAKEIYTQAKSSKKADLTTHLIAMRFDPDIKNSLITPKTNVKDVFSGKTNPLLKPPSDIIFQENKPTDLKENKSRQINNDDILKVFKAVGLKDTIINEMVALSEQGGYFTGKLSTFFGILVCCKNLEVDIESTLNKVKLIPIKDINCVLPDHSNTKKAKDLQKSGYKETQRESRPNPRWIHMSKDLGIPIDLSVTDKRKYKQVTPPLNVAGKLSVFSKQNLPSNLANYDILEFGDFIFAIHKKDENFPAFKFHCQNLGECLFPAKLDPSSLKIALKSYLFSKEFRKENIPAVNTVIPTSPSGKLIDYPELLANLPEYFYNHFRAKNLDPVYRGLYNLLNYLDFSGFYAEIHLRALIQASIRYLLIDRYKEKLPNFNTLDQMTTFAFDTLVTSLINDRPTGASTLGKQLDNAVSESISSYRQGQFVQNPPANTPAGFNITPYYNNKLALFRRSEEDSDLKLLADFKIYKDESPQGIFMNESRLRELKKVITTGVYYSHPLFDLKAEYHKIDRDFNSIFPSPEFIKLSDWNSETTYLIENNRDEPFIQSFDKLVSKTFSKASDFIGIAEHALNILISPDMYLSLSKICLECLKDFKQHDLFPGPNKHLDVQNAINSLEKERKKLETAKDHKERQRLCLNIFNEASKQCGLSLKNTSKNNSRYLFLQFTVLPWINQAINPKEQIVDMVEQIFLYLYRIFQLFERGMLVMSIPNNLESYRKFQSNLLDILMKYAGFMNKHGYAMKQDPETKKFFKTFHKINIYFNSQANYIVTDLADVNEGAAKALLSVLAVNANLFFAKSRIESIKEQKVRLQLRNTHKLLTEMGDVHFNYDGGLDQSPAGTTKRAGCILKINNLIDTALSSNNELIFWPLQILKFHIELDNIMLNMIDPVHALTSDISNLIKSIGKVFSVPQWTNLGPTWSAKKEQIFFNTLNVVSPLLQFVTGLQRVLYYAFWLSKKIENPDFFTTHQMLKDVNSMLALQSKILKQMRVLDPFYGMHLNNWIFMDKHLYTFPYIHKCLDQFLSANDICAINHDNIIQITSLNTSLLREEMTPQMILKELQDLIISSSNQLKQDFESKGGKFLPSRSLFDELGDEEELKKYKSLSNEKKQELEKQIQAKVAAIDDIQKKSLARIQSLLEEKSEEANELFDELSGEEEKLSTTSSDEKSIERKAVNHRPIPRNPATISTSIGKLPRASFTKISVVEIHESFPPDIKKECIEMGKIYIDMRRMIDQDQFSNDPIKEIAKKTSQLQPYKDSNNAVLCIRAIWHEIDINAYAALHFLNYKYYYEFFDALEASEANYSKLSSLIEDKPEFKLLLELTWQNITDLRKSFEHARTILENRIEIEKGYKADIIEKKTLKWWREHRYAGGFIKPPSQNALRFIEMNNCLALLDSAINNCQRIENQIITYRSKGNLDNSIVNFKDFAEFPALETESTQDIKKDSHSIRDSHEAAEVKTPPGLNNIKQAKRKKKTKTRPVPLSSIKEGDNEESVQERAAQFSDQGSRIKIENGETASNLQSDKKQNPNQTSVTIAHNLNFWSSTNQNSQSRRIEPSHPDEKKISKNATVALPLPLQNSPSNSSPAISMFPPVGRVEKEPQETLESYRLKAERGDPMYQTLLGNCYNNGKGVVKDLKEAARLYRLAADQGHFPAQYFLGSCYEKGKGVVKDLEQAASLYRLAADQGHTSAQYNLGCCYEKGKGVDKDLKEAVSLYRLAADKGDFLAQNSLGLCHEQGLGVPKDYKQAINYYRLAVKQRHAPAQTNLGSCYERGIGVEKDQKEALQLYELAVKQGNAAAQTNLGSCHENCHGVNKDLKEAVRLYRLAAKQGYAAAQTNLGSCYENGKGVDKDFKEAARLYALAADQKYEPAQYSLGCCYEKGIGVNKNLEKAAGLYSLAANQGNISARNNLNRLREKHGITVTENLDKVTNLNEQNFLNSP